MFHRILIALTLAVLGYIIYLFFTTKTVDSFDSIFQGSRHEPVHESVRVQLSPSAEGPRTITPSGPHPPNATSSLEAQTPPDVRGQDPLDDVNSSNDFQDNLRHPERLFSPGMKQTDKHTAVMSGVASTVSGGTSSHAIQLFSPEMAQNGGEFMEGIVANDTLDDREYSAF
jgi:hypothetical protein